MIIGKHFSPMVHLGFISNLKKLHMLLEVFLALYRPNKQQNTCHFGKHGILITVTLEVQDQTQNGL